MKIINLHDAEKLTDIILDDLKIDLDNSIKSIQMTLKNTDNDKLSKWLDIVTEKVEYLKKHYESIDEDVDNYIHGIMRTVDTLSLASCLINTVIKLSCEEEFFLTKKTIISEIENLPFELITCHRFAKISDHKRKMVKIEGMDNRLLRKNHLSQALLSIVVESIEECDIGTVTLKNTGNCSFYGLNSMKILMQI